MFHKCFNIGFGYLQFSNSFIGCSWIAPLTSAEMVMRGLTCQPFIPSVCMNGLYLKVISLCALFGNMSWQ